MTAMVGLKRRNDPSLSSASTTISRPLPSLAFEPSALSFPPTTAVGSSPAFASTVAIIEVVVVLPVRPRDGVTGVRAEVGHAGPPGAADPDEVDLDLLVAKHPGVLLIAGMYSIRSTIINSVYLRASGR